MPEKELIKKTFNEDGSIGYKIKKTGYSVMPDKHVPTHWYVFKITPRNARTLYEGSKDSCIKYVERLLGIKG